MLKKERSAEDKIESFEIHYVESFSARDGLICKVDIHLVVYHRLRALNREIHCDGFREFVLFGLDVIREGRRDYFSV